MKISIAAAFPLLAASSLSAQTAPAVPDLATATPIAGNWSYSATGGGSEATFANAGGFPQVIVHCSRATRRVSIAKPATSAADSIDVWTSSQTRKLPASFNPGTGRLTVELDATDALLDALSNSRGRLGFTVSQQPPLVVPAWAEVARVVEDCRA
jgi:hypothetical protein